MNATTYIIRCYVLFIIILNDFTGTVLSFEQTCPKLTLINGWVRYRMRAKSAKFNCNKGFQLVGVKYASCMRGKWDTKAPICVRYGCRPPASPEVNGHFIESYRGAVVKVVCNPGYSLIGSPSVYCNGLRWNETFPVCRVTNKNPAISCDFEDPDLCGWSQDLVHDYNWKRKNGSIVEASMPKIELKGKNNSDHYMFLFGFTKDKYSARLFSPVYPASYSQKSCFKFNYFIFSPPNEYLTSLRVYVKPEGVNFYDLISESWLDGKPNRIEIWKEESFNITTTDKPFQIVVEVNVSSAYVSYTGFDDASILFGDNCTGIAKMMSTTEYYTSDYGDDTTAVTATFSSTDVTPPDIPCDCRNTCIPDVTCCSDHDKFKFCQDFGKTDKSTSTSTVGSTRSTTIKSTKTIKVIQATAAANFTTTSTTTTTTPPPPTTTTTKTNTRTTTRKEVNREENGSFRVPLNIPQQNFSSFRRPDQRNLHDNSSNITNTSQFWKNGKTNISQNKSGAVRKPQKTVKVSPVNVTSKRPTSYGYGKRTTKMVLRFKKPTGLQNVTRYINRTSSTRMINPNTTTSTTPTTPKTTPTTTTSTTISTTKATTKSLDKIAAKGKLVYAVSGSADTSKDTGKKPAEPDHGNDTTITNELRGVPSKVKVNEDQKNDSQYLTGIIAAIISSLVLIVIIILGVVCYRRKRKRETERESMVEDSDVRYLTSDEILDFRLARPADDEL